MQYAKYLLLVFAIPLCNRVMATHLVGGELYYTCLGNNNYEITLIIYRDCNGLVTTDFDNPAYVSIFEGGQLAYTRMIPFAERKKLPLIPPNNCTQLPPFVCTERGVYKDTVYLPPSTWGYSIAHQRCCRNGSIANLMNPGDQGNTYLATIPANDTVCNSSPSFNEDPPVVLCLN